jgi:hypothetical protein
MSWYMRFVGKMQSSAPVDSTPVHGTQCLLGGCRLAPVVMVHRHWRILMLRNAVHFSKDLASMFGPES